MKNMTGTSPALDAEWPLLLAACSAGSNNEKQIRLRALLHEPIRWNALFALAERHGVQPLLYQALATCEDAIPPEPMRVLKQNCQTNLHKAMLLSRELIRIVDHLAKVKCEAMPYKGLALAETLYGDIALRQAGDIDLLIRATELPRIRGALRELGYVPHSIFSETEERAYLESGYEYAFDGPAGPNLLEVQWAIQPRFYAVDFDMEGLFQRSVSVTVASCAMKTPSPEDQFIVLSLHAAKHVWGRLIWLCDLARIMNSPTLNWNWIADQARELGIVRIIRVVVKLANRLLDVAVPAAAEARLPKDSSAAELAAEIQTYIAASASYDVESIDYFRLMLWLRERQSDRARFLTRLILTPGPSEWAAVRLPSSLFPLYRLVRLSRLASKFVSR
jgi:hypothetical protein